MKRLNHLYEQLISRENIELAIKAVNKSHRSKNGVPNKTVQKVKENSEECIKELQRIVEEGFVPSPTRDFKIFDRTANKIREIHEPRLWPDQYIHHMLIQVLEPVMMRGMDFWCCASIPGRGTKKARVGIQKWMMEDVTGLKDNKKYELLLANGDPAAFKVDIENTRFCVECDIHHFYESLLPAVVVERMEHLIKDRKVLDLIQRVVSNGILIGAYPSQWFANTVLQPLDHMIREKLHIKHYVRYMDNLTLFSSNKRKLRKAVLAIQQWLESRHMTLKPNWRVYNTTCFKAIEKRRKLLKKGMKAFYRRHPRLVNAAGYMFGHGYILMRKKNLLRLKRQLAKLYKKMANHQAISLEMASSLLSRLSMLQYCNNRTLINKYVQKGLKKKLRKIVSVETKRRNALRNSMMIKEAIQ